MGAISALRAKAGGGKDQGILRKDAMANIVPTNGNTPFIAPLELLTVFVMPVISPFRTLVQVLFKSSLTLQHITLASSNHTPGIHVETAYADFEVNLLFTGNSVVFGRTPAEVVSIVTLGAKGNKGGFFPKGLNGNIK